MLHVKYCLKTIAIISYLELFQHRSSLFTTLQERESLLLHVQPVSNLAHNAIRLVPVMLLASASYSRNSNVESVT